MGNSWDHDRDPRPGAAWFRSPPDYELRCVARAAVCNAQEMRSALTAVALLALFGCRGNDPPPTFYGAAQGATGAAADPDTGSEATADSAAEDPAEVDAAPIDPPDAAADEPGGPGPGTARSSCEGDGPAPGRQRITLEHEGRERAYLLHVPSGYDHGAGTPLVINFHGTSGTAEGQAGFSRYDVIADRRTVLVAYPEGLPLDGTNVFDAGLRDFTNEPRDDVDLTRAIIDSVAERACLNRRRVYATGMSNGGRMSYRLACDAADVIAAIAPVAGSLSMETERCSPSRPISNIHFHGTADEVAPYGEAAGLSLRPVPDMFRLWADFNGCTGEPENVFDIDDVRCEAFTQCEAGTEVVLCTVEGGGHCWPGTPDCGLGTSTTTIDASESGLDFLLRFELP